MEQYERHRREKKTWVEATLSTHLFEADLEDNLSPGVHTVTVRAVDEFGRIHHAHAILEITAGFEGGETGIRYPNN